ncbi:uncharacterized protein LOC135809324 [Sycon ciliatum]|uniref:uncharacterized protein LOC135809324 n=1 Tax=Sycon ciliatum TaxID=27933 RepID=UPI0031F6FDB8
MLVCLQFTPQLMLRNQSGCPNISVFDDSSSGPVSSASISVPISATGRDCLYDCEADFNSTWIEIPEVPCRRSCPSTVVAGIGDVCSLNGCTQIDGPLIISILYVPPTPDTMVSALCTEVPAFNFTANWEFAMRDVQVINGSLQISHTACLHSLNFLRNVRIIKGDIIINHNGILREFGGFAPQVVDGTITIAGNPRLCRSAISSWSARIQRPVSMSRNGLAGACITCLSYNLNFRKDPIEIIIEENDCTASLSNEYPDIDISNLRHVGYRSASRQVDLDPNKCSGVHDMDSLNQSVFTVDPSASTDFLQCGDDYLGWNIYFVTVGRGSQVGTIQVQQVDVRLVLGSCACVGFWLSSLFYDETSGQIYDLYRSNVGFNQLDVQNVVPILSHVRASSTYLPATPSRSSESTLNITWELGLVGCNVDETFYGLEFRLVKAPASFNDFQRSAAAADQCMENQPNGSFGLVLCNASLSTPTSGQAIYTADSYEKSYFLNPQIRPVEASRVFRGLQPATLYYVQVVVTIGGGEYGDWYLVPPRLTWTQPATVPAAARYHQPLILNAPDTRSGIGLASQLAWNQNLSLLGQEPSAVDRYQLIFSAAPGLPIFLRNLLCAREFEARMAALGCGCGQRTCNPRRREFLCSVRCPVDIAQCVLPALEEEWCFVLASGSTLTIEACNSLECEGNSNNAAARRALAWTAPEPEILCADPEIRTMCEPLLPPGTVLSLCAANASNSNNRKAGDNSTTIILSAVLIPVSVIFVLLVTIGLWLRQRKKTTLLKEEMNRLEIIAGTDYTLVEYVPDDWELDEDQLELHDMLGEGAFGIVYKGIMYQKGSAGPVSSQIVAVKTLKAEGAYEKNLFLQEASVMKKFDCPYIVQLRGIVSENAPKVAMEYMECGDLKNYLRSVRKKAKSSGFMNAGPVVHGLSSDGIDSDSGVPTTVGTIKSGADTPNAGLPNALPSEEQFMTWAEQLAQAIQHLVEKRFVHRDISARNCMLSADLTLKLSDFGLSRDIYSNDYYRKVGRGALPLRWLPPEALRDGMYSSATDVWSYGIVLYELATLAELPYRGKSNEEVMEMLLRGEHLEPPLLTGHGFPALLNDIMLICWQFDAECRPSMEVILAAIESGVPPQVSQDPCQAQSRSMQREDEEGMAKSGSSEAGSEQSVSLSTPLLDPAAERREAFVSGGVQKEVVEEIPANSSSSSQVKLPPSAAAVVESRLTRKLSTAESCDLPKEPAPMLLNRDELLETVAMHSSHNCIVSADEPLQSPERSVHSSSTCHSEWDVPVDAQSELSGEEVWDVPVDEQSELQSLTNNDNEWDVPVDAQSPTNSEGEWDVPVDAQSPPNNDNEWDVPIDAQSPTNSEGEWDVPVDAQIPPNNGNEWDVPVDAQSPTNSEGEWDVPVDAQSPPNNDNEWDVPVDAQSPTNSEGEWDVPVDAQSPPNNGNEWDVPVDAQSPTNSEGEWDVPVDAQSPTNGDNEWDVPVDAQSPPNNGNEWDVPVDAQSPTNSEGEWDVPVDAQSPTNGDNEWDVPVDAQSATNSEGEWDVPVDAQSEARNEVSLDSHLNTNGGSANEGERNATTDTCTPCHADSGKEQDVLLFDFPSLVDTHKLPVDSETC